ncbi:MAG: hypothetical protein P1T08_03640 [Acidimicrobiia bacterium]|nr:hypothetical protein [Acidimicrobiia bacterium]
MKGIITAFMTMALVAGLQSPAGATEIAEILSSPDEWSGRVVEVTGELVGDFGRHSGAFWLQINDDPYATHPLLETGLLAGANVGVTLRVPPELFEEMAAVEQPGGYRWRGPIVSATGEFRYHDPDRTGETYIAVTSLELVEPGYHLPSEATGPLGAIGVILAAVAGGVLLQHARQRRRQQRLED